MHTDPHFENSARDNIFKDYTFRGEYSLLLEKLVEAERMRQRDTHQKAFSPVMYWDNKLLQTAPTTFEMDTLTTMIAQCKKVGQQVNIGFLVRRVTEDIIDHALLRKETLEMRSLPLDERTFQSMMDDAGVTNPEALLGLPIIVYTLNQRIAALSLGTAHTHYAKHVELTR